MTVDARIVAWAVGVYSPSDVEERTALRSLVASAVSPGVRGIRNALSDPSERDVPLSYAVGNGEVDLDTDQVVLESLRLANTLRSDRIAACIEESFRGFAAEIIRIKGDIVEEFLGDHGDPMEGDFADHLRQLKDAVMAKDEKEIERLIMLPHTTSEGPKWVKPVKPSDVSKMDDDEGLIDLKPPGDDLLPKQKSDDDAWGFLNL